MKTTLGLIALALAGVASSPAFAVAGAEAGPPVAVGNLRYLEEGPPPEAAGGMEDVPLEAADGMEDMPPPDFEDEPELEHWRKRWHGGGGCYPGSWRWPRCRWGRRWGRHW